MTLTGEATGARDHRLYRDVVKNCYKMVVYGDTKWMLFTQIFGTFSVVGLAALCVFVFKLGMLGVFVAVLCDEIIRAVINSIRFIKIKF